MPVDSRGPRRTDSTDRADPRRPRTAAVRPCLIDRVEPAGRPIRALHRTDGRTRHTDRSITDVDVFEAELARTRERGYSTSIGEYYPGHNAVAAPVFGADGTPAFLLVVVAADSQLGEDALAAVGEEVVAGAERATKRIGGRPPRSCRD